MILLLSGSVFLLAITCNALDADLTIDIRPGKVECFHQFIAGNISFEVEYQVIDGGDIDVNFYAVRPSGQIIFHEMRKSEGTHNFRSEEAGDYKFCLDNSFSRISNKLVFFELIIDDDDNDDGNDDFRNLPQEDTPLGVKLEDLRRSLELVNRHLDKTVQHQNLLRVLEARDRSILEDNFDRINTWSCVHLAVLMIVGVVNVVMIRSLFDDKSKLHKFLKMGRT